MNVFYEEDGAFKAGSVLADNSTSLQVESSHGKRSKIKASAVLIRFSEPGLSGFMEHAQKIAEDIDPDFLWECCPSEDFSFDALGSEYFGHSPSPLEGAGVLIRLHHSPMYFYKKGKGKYKAAPPDALKAALASQEKKKRMAELQAELASRLVNRELPEAISVMLPDLLYAPDKNGVEYKAVALACEQTGLSVPRLLEACGALPSSHDYHLNRFLFEHFPKGPPSLENCDIVVPDLPLGDAEGFSIDDATTTEIDDAFSVSFLEDGHLRIGIHIAAPAIGIAKGSNADLHALKMLSTLYIPGRKFTMLPQSGIEAFTLSENRICPVLSLYLEVNADFEVISTRNALESVPIVSNLRHESIGQDCRFAKELDTLLNFAQKLEALRGKSNNVNQIDYNFRVENDRVSITERERGAPLDKIVSELMIHANTEWAKQLSSSGYAAIYRAQQNGKVRHETAPAPHQGLGVSQYAWTTSPLRRYVDLVNQRQLVSMVEGKAPAYDTGSDEIPVIMRDFDQAHDLYNDIQRTMERYWCLRWLLQENISTMAGTVQRENWVKLDGLPLAGKVSSLPEMPAGSRVSVVITQVDLFELGFHARFLERI